MVLTIIAFVFKCHKSRPADNDWPERKIKEKNIGENPYDLRVVKTFFKHNKGKRKK